MVLKAGGTGQMIFAVQGRPPFAVAQTHVELSDAPDGISIQALTSGTNGAAISFKIDPTKIKPGSKGNLIVEAFSERTLPAVNGKPPEKTRWSMGFLPAISFEVAGK
jgi:hypothetical protein